MSQLGDQIRMQQRVAHHLAEDVLNEAKQVRTQLHTVTWESSAAHFFRQQLGDFAKDLDTVQASVDDLATHIGHHATVVEEHERALGSALHWPIDQVGHTTASAAEWAHQGVEAAQHTWDAVTDFVGG